MSALGYVALYGVLVVLASLLGGWLPSIMRLTHQRMQLVVSVVAGLMLGVALFHLLPHAASHMKSFESALCWTMGGLITTFLLIRAFHTHQHGVGEHPDPEVELHIEGHEQCGHAHHHQGHHAASRGVSWIGIALGLSLHTLIDGVALAAAVASETALAEQGGVPGIGTFLAIALHKPLDSLSITALMASQGWSARAQQWMNFGYSLICPIGAATFVVGISHFGDDSSITVSAALAFAAGVFLCVALADLLPEVEFHSHNRLSLSAALLVGVAIAYAIGFIEPEGHHDHGGHETHGHKH